jgi:hypothetical protein
VQAKRIFRHKTIESAPGLIFKLSSAPPRWGSEFDARVLCRKMIFSREFGDFGKPEKLRNLRQLQGQPYKFVTPEIKKRANPRLARFLTMMKQLLIDHVRRRF